MPYLNLHYSIAAPKVRNGSWWYENASARRTDRMDVPSDGDLREDRDQDGTKLYVEIGIGTPIVFVHEYC